jgi:phage head maturation protease
MSTATETFDPSVDQTRTFHARAEVSAPERREISGVGVPLEDRIQVYPGLYEEFAQDCDFEDIDRAKLRIDHGTLAGVLASHSRATGKLNVTLRASKVAAGDDALVLAHDGALDSFSIGFRSKDFDQIDNEDGSITIRHTRVQVREFSLTATPYYPNALVTEVRHNDAHERSTPMSTATDTTATQATEQRADSGIDEVRSQLDSIIEEQRAFRSIISQYSEAPAIVRDRRSPAQFLIDLCAGDEATTRAANEYLSHLYDPEYHVRAYTGGTSADAPMQDQWVGDLTRIFDSSSGLLNDLFSVGTLPAKGNVIEYGELATNTTQVTEQAAEGDDLAFGKVTLTTKTAPVKTYGGYTQLTRQGIERSTMPLLARNLEALGKAAGARKKAVMRAAFEALVTARVALAANAGVILLGATLGSSTSAQWEAVIRKAAIRYSRENTAPQALVVSDSVFEKLQGFTVSGDRVLRIGEGNSAGSLNLLTIRGNMAGLPVYLDPDKSGDSAVFVHADAIRQYDSALVSLQDENIINLSKDFSVYRYGAIAPEIPALVVPVKLAAS